MFWFGDNNVTPNDIDDYKKTKQKIEDLKTDVLLNIYEKIGDMSKELDKIKKELDTARSDRLDIKNDIIQLKNDNVNIQNKLIDVIQIVNPNYFHK